MTTTVSAPRRGDLARHVSRRDAGDPDDAFDFFRRHYAADMETMFAAVGPLYGEHWNDFFHFAIFDPPDLDRDEAYRRTHERYLAALDVDGAGSAIELACGRGALTRLIAERCRGPVVGIDISRAQLSAARRFHAENLRFEHLDVMRVHEIGQRFDAAICLDAACYLPDKALAAERIARVLTPGARFVLVDWCSKERATRLQEELVLHPFMRGWAIPSLETPSSWQRHLERGGFRVLEVDDLSDRTRPNWELGYQRAIEAVSQLRSVDLPRLLWKGLSLGEDGLALIEAQLDATLYLKAGFDAGLLRYVLFVAERR